MTFSQFRRLIPRAQLLHTLTAGTYLAQRIQEVRGVNLYHLSDKGRGFFVELGVEKATRATVVLRSFVSSGPLEEYAHGVRLPE